MSRAYVQVALPVPLRTLFTYGVPEGVEISAGTRVQVSFGPRRLIGLVAHSPTTEAPAGMEPSKIKDLQKVLDEGPVLSEPVLRLVRWMVGYYHLPPGEAYLLPLPPSMSGGRKGEVQEHKYKTERVARYKAEPEPGQRIGAVMDRALSWLREAEVATSSEVRDATGAGLDVLRRLSERGWIDLSTREVPRDPFARMPLEPHPEPRLTREQDEVITSIAYDMGRFAGHLIHGVTGSGKTEIYLRLIKATLEEGHGALVLVPEIALTPQLVSRFRGRLGDRIAVLHSGLDKAARHEQWERIASGELKVVIGARSALFAPIPDLGMIVVDEEHDSSFKQDTAPRYHARDLALVRGRFERCPVVLGTATPSMESWANTERGKLELHTLAERVESRPMPTVELVDMRSADCADDGQLFSQALVDAMAENLTRQEQTILLINRRGFASFILCRSCGERLACSSCSVSYTWHRARSRLVCHYCDHVLPLPERCPSCDDDALVEMGAGTEQIVDRVSELVPGARVARMDRDTTRGHKLTALLSAFRGREIDILVGTQMVAKGHDFPGVTLVGVLSAEMGLGLPDFRASERTFALLTQMAGRAGRAERPGRVLVQTFMPEHPMLGFARGHDAPGFLSEELLERQARGFPPARHLALFKISGAEDQATWEAADRLRHQLHRLLDQLPEGPTRPYILGPHPAPIERLRDRWRYQVLVNGPDRVLLGRLLALAVNAVDNAKMPNHIRVALDVDPYAFL